MPTSLHIDRLVKASLIPNNNLADRIRDLRDFANRLTSVSERARKLLVQIAKRAYQGGGPERRTDVAYLPELYECCGLEVDAMYSLLDELKTGHFVDIEQQYPFEDVRILPSSSGWNPLATLSRFSEAQRVPLRDILVDLNFDLLR